MAWYSIQLFDQITDWQNNPLVEPLEEGQQLFIRGADLLAGTYQPPIAAVQPTAVPPAAGTPPTTNNDGGGDTGEGTNPDRPNFTDYPQPVGEPPPGAVFPLGTPWISVTELDTGFCPVISGSGWTGSLNWPVSGRTINENRGFRLGHSGIDINASLGSPVFAAQSGVVVWAGWSTWGFGNLIVIAHGGTWHTYYAHLSEVYVSCGQSVGVGTTIGATGQTGAATWPHLHFEVRNQGFSYNPANYLP
jgi:murein DD-endopeptidase MepM/ murein hydrolase activator NlpD